MPRIFISGQAVILKREDAGDYEVYTGKFVLNGVEYEVYVDVLRVIRENYPASLEPASITGLSL